MRRRRSPPQSATPQPLRAAETKLTTSHEPKLRLMRCSQDLSMFGTTPSTYFDQKSFSSLPDYFCLHSHSPGPYSVISREIHPVSLDCQSQESGYLFVRDLN